MIDKLKEAVQFCKENNIKSFKCGDIEIEMDESAFITEVDFEKFIVERKKQLEKNPKKISKFREY